MARISRYSEATKKRAIAMYQEGYKLQEITAETGIEQTYVSKLALNAGCPSRKGQIGKKKSAVCPKCKNKYPKGSNFCNNCGCDVRSEEKILLKKVELLRGYLLSIPNRDSASEADNITREIIRYFESRV